MRKEAWRRKPSLVQHSIQPHHGIDREDWRKIYALSLPTNVFRFFASLQQSADKGLLIEPDNKLFSEGQQILIDREMPYRLQSVKEGQQLRVILKRYRKRKS